MKKSWANASFAKRTRRTNAKRAQRAAIRRKNRSEQRTPPPPASKGSGKVRPLKVLRLKAPADLSLARNPVATIRFLNKIIRTQAAAVDIDLSGVSDLTAEGLLAVHAVVKSYPKRIGGNRPEDERVRRVFERSGFCDHVRGWDPEIEPEGVIGGRYQKGHTVDAGLAGRLAHPSGAVRTGSDRANYGVLIELMQNTRNHATVGKSEPVPWYVIRLPRANRIEFAFVDLGIGLLRGSKLNAWRRLQKMVGRSTTLRAAMTGQVGSREDEYFRGKGLPRIHREAVKLGHVKDLIVIANRAMGNVSTDSYTGLGPGLSGTIYYWTMEETPNAHDDT